MSFCEIITSSSQWLVVALTPMLSFSATTRSFVEYDCDIPFQELNNKRVSHVEFSAIADGNIVLGPDALHMHHIHVSRPKGEGDRVKDFHLWATHGDLWSKNAGNYTYSIPYPDGYCMIYESVRTHYESSVCVNDVRVKEERSAPMNVQVIATFRIASMPCKPISQVWIHSPIQKDAPYWTYATTNMADTMTWWSTQWPYSGHLLDITRYHSHQRRMDTTYFVRGTLASYGIDLQRWTPIDDSNRFPYILRTQLSSDTAHVRDVLDRHHVCKFAGAHVKREDGSAYDGASHIECEHGHVFHQGRVYTIVKLHMPRYDTSTDLVYTHDVPWFYMDTGWSEYSKTAPLMATDVNRKHTVFSGSYVAMLNIMWPFQVLDNLKFLLTDVLQIMNDDTFIA